MRSGWSMKKLHRLIVLSQAYQRDSIEDAAHAASARIDPDNLLLWRMNSRRLESEAVRDGVLAVSGRLDRRIGGPEIDAGLGETTYRRSIYYRHAPEKFMTFLQTFDAPNTNECYRRIETVVPQQALALSNSTLAVDQGRWLADRMSGEGDLNRAHDQKLNDQKFVGALFEQVLGREPSKAESSSCLEFLQAQISAAGRREEIDPVRCGPAIDGQGFARAAPAGAGRPGPRFVESQRFHHGPLRARLESRSMSDCDCHRESRRAFLADVGMGFTGLALGALLSRDGVVRAGVPKCRLKSRESSPCLRRRRRA